jgi:hypothetical protein
LTPLEKKRVQWHNPSCNRKGECTNGPATDILPQFGLSGKGTNWGR